MLGAGLTFSPFFIQAGNSISANDKIGVGLIGCNGMGFDDLKAFLRNPEVECVALCDVDKNVLEKRAGFKLIQKDVFLNIAGGLRVNDPAIDLAVLAAILSSSLDITIEPGTCMAGEVGLSGEIRPVNRIEQRILEAEKLGFTRILVPHSNLRGFDTSKCSIQIVQVRKVEEAFRQLFG